MVTISLKIPEALARRLEVEALAAECSKSAIVSDALKEKFDRGDPGSGGNLRYKDVPMSLADASLVKMSEQYGHVRLLTTDREFQVYRRFGRSVIPLLSPW